MRFHPCRREPIQAVGAVSGYDGECSDPVEVFFFADIWKVIAIHDKESTIHAIVDTQVYWYDPLLAEAMEKGADITKFWQPTIVFPDAVAVKTRILEDTHLLSNWGQNRFLASRSEVKISNKGYW